MSIALDSCMKYYTLNNDTFCELLPGVLCSVSLHAPQAANARTTHIGVYRIKRGFKYIAELVVVIISRLNGLNFFIFLNEKKFFCVVAILNNKQPKDGFSRPI